MNKTILFLAMCATLLFAGCNKDKEPQFPSFKIEAVVENYENYDFFEVRALTVKPFDMSGEEFVVAKAPIINGKFTMELPAKLDDKFIAAAMGFPPTVTISDKSVKIGTITEFVFTENSTELGLVQVAFQGESMWLVHYVFVDKDVKVKGVIYDDETGVNIVQDLNLKRGWNMVYEFFEYYEDETGVKSTTTKPNLDFKWYSIDDMIF